MWTVKDLSEDERRMLRATAQAVVFRNQDGTAALLDELHRYLPTRGGAKKATSAGSMMAGEPILVVDDNARESETRARAAVLDGYEVRTASSAEEA